MMPFPFVAAADTMLVRQVPLDRSGFDQVVFVAAGLAQIVTLVVVVLLAVIFFRMWKAQQAIQEHLGRLASKVDPMIASATAATENVRVLTDAVRTGAVASAEALTEATERVRDAVGGIADRIDEFGDLMARVTGKAEAVADVAGAAITTFKAGSRLFRPRHEHRRPPDEPRRARDDGEGDGGAVRHEGNRTEPRHLADEGDDDRHESPYADGPHHREPDGAPAPGSAPRSAPRRKRRRNRRGGGGAEDRGEAGDRRAD